MSTFAEVIKFVGGTAVIGGLIVWLIRSVVLHVLSKDVETYKNQLQNESAATLERLRHQLRLAAAEHEKRTALLQEKRAEVVATLYTKTVDFLAAAESFAAIVEWSG